MTIEWLGFAGTSLVVLAYFPQVIHLIKEKCTAGISLGAYLTWTLASVILLSYAISQRDPVFIALQSYQLFATAFILFFSYKHKGCSCALHGGAGHA